MKKLMFALMLLALLVVPSTVGAKEPCKGDNCTTIQDGTLYTTDGELVTTGYSEWGYNYQAHMFNGMYCDYHPIYRPGGTYHEWCQANYGDVNLVMKWNEAWLSNKDCDGDGKLDRHYGLSTYIGSGAWTTNHMSGGKGKDHWTYFVKIVAVPSDAYYDDANGNGKADDDELWYTADGTVIGPSIWGSFAIVQEVESGEGATYVSPSSPGLGNW